MKFNKVRIILTIGLGCFILNVNLLYAQYTLRDVDSLQKVASYWSNQPRSLDRDTHFLIALRFHYYSLMGNSLIKDNSLLDSIDRFSAGLAWPKARAFYHGCQGITYLINMLYSSSFEEYQKAASIFEQTNDNYWLGYTYENMAVSISRLYDFENTIDTTVLNQNFIIVKKIVDYSTKYNLPRVLASIYQINGQSFLKLNEIDSALYYFNLGYSWAKNIDAPFYMASNLDLYINTLISQDRISEAEAKIDELKSIIVNNQLVNLLCNYNYEKALIARKRNRMKECIYYAKQSILNTKEAHTFQDKYVFHKLLYESYKSVGQSDLAIVHLEEMNKIRIKVDGQKLKDKILELNYKYENEKKLNIIKELQLNEITSQQAGQLVVKNILLGLGFIIFSLLGVLVYLNRRLRNRNTQLSFKNREIEEALVKGKNLERSRVASELHDNLNTKVAALGWHIEAIDGTTLDTSNRNIVQKIHQLSGDIYKDIRLISHNLIPPELDTYGLDLAVKRLCTTLNTQTRVKFHYVSNEFVNSLDKKMEHQLFNIILELSNNIIKHSLATNAWLSIFSNSKVLTLTIYDDGVGAKDVIEFSGIGIKSIFSRVEELNGKIVWQKQLNPGMKFLIEVPVVLK